METPIVQENLYIIFQVESAARARILLAIVVTVLHASLNITFIEYLAVFYINTSFERLIFSHFSKRWLISCIYCREEVIAVLFIARS